MSDQKDEKVIVAQLQEKVGEPNPVLVAALEEIKAILEKNDIGGGVFLVDGKGEGLYHMHLDKPSWSTVVFTPAEEGTVTLDISAGLKSRPEDSNRTLGAVLLTGDMIDGCLHMLRAIVDQFEHFSQIERKRGKFTPVDMH